MHHIKCAVLRDKMSFGLATKIRNKAIDVAIYSYQSIRAANRTKLLLGTLCINECRALLVACDL